MMDVPVKKFLRLLQEDAPVEVRAAAVLVCGELGLKEAELGAEILARLDDTDGTVRLNAIKASGQLKLAKAVPTLLERIKSGGQEASLAAEAASKLGADAVKKLQALMHHVVPGVRKYIAAALTSVSSGQGEVGVGVLLDADPLIASSASKAIISRVPTMAAAEKKKIVDDVLGLLADKKKKLPASAELPMLRLLASLNDPRCADVLWERTVPPYGNDVRALSLSTVGGWLQSPTKEQWRRLFVCATERDFSVAAPALVLLSRLPVSEKQLADWLMLFHAPDSAARRLAIDKIGDRDTPEIAAALMEQLGHNNRDLRDAARSKLATLDQGRKLLVSALLNATTADQAWQLARTTAPFARTFSPKLRGEIFEQACHYLEADDTRNDAFFYLLREADANALRDELFERAIAKRKKKQYESAHLYLKLLARDPAIGFVMRLELGLVGLKLSAKNVAQDARNMDHCLRNISTALSQDVAETTTQVEKAKWLEPDDLFYLGFHFAEHMGTEKEFGTAMLRHVIKATPKSKLGTTAKNKLKSSGAT